jgi:hypothetical protein
MRHVPSRLLAKAIRRESGDHTGSASGNEVAVSRVGTVVGTASAGSV